MKRPYEQPELITLGELSEVTLGSLGSCTDANSTNVTKAVPPGLGQCPPGVGL